MKKPVSPRLDKRVAFDERETVDDGYGNYEGRFVEKLQCWAAFTYLRGSEVVMAARLEGKQPIVVRVRATSATKAIDHDWQMRDLRNGQWTGTAPNQVWNGPTFAVRSVIPTEDGRFIDITVERGVAT